MTHQTTDSSFQADVLGAQGWVLVDFWAPWCAPCRVQGPILEQYALLHPDLKVVKMNTEDHPGVAGQLGIRSIPTLVLFKDGRPVLGGVGVHDAKRLDALLTEAKNRAGAAQA